MRARLIPVSCLIAFMVLNFLIPRPVAGTSQTWAGHSPEWRADTRWPENSLRDDVDAAQVPMKAINMVVAGQIGGEAFAIDVVDNYVYAGVGPRMLILDYSDPTHPVVVGQSRVLRDLVRDVVVVGTYAYANDGGLWVIDVAQPASPREVGFYALDTIVDMAVSGSYAYLADLQSGLRVIDISDPARLRQVAFCPVSRRADAVAVSGPYVYVLAGGRNFWVVDVSNPRAPAQVGSCELTGAVVGSVTAVGSYAYLGGCDCLSVVDVSNPAAPREVGCCPLQGTACDVAIAGNYAYAVGFRTNPFHGGSEGAALWILDISVPGSPGIVHFSSDVGG